MASFWDGEPDDAQRTELARQFIARLSRPLAPILRPSSGHYYGLRGCRVFLLGMIDPLEKEDPASQVLAEPRRLAKPSHFSLRSKCSCLLDDVLPTRTGGLIAGINDLICFDQDR